MKIYEQHDKAFKGISAYAILRAGVVVGKVAFKRGNCRVTAYTHLHGLAMTKGIANGGGYDMASAAASAGFNKVPDGMSDHALAIKMALQNDGQHWDNALRQAGYEVVGVI